MTFLYYSYGTFWAAMQPTSWSANWTMPKKWQLLCCATHSSQRSALITWPSSWFVCNIIMIFLNSDVHAMRIFILLWGHQRGIDTKVMSLVPWSVLIRSSTIGIRVYYERFTIKNQQNLTLQRWSNVMSGTTWTKLIVSLSSQTIYILQPFLLPLWSIFLLPNQRKS